MATCKDARDETSETAIAAAAETAVAAAVETAGPAAPPAAAAAPDQPAASVETAVATAEAAKAAAPELKVPPVSEPASPTRVVSPPPFLRRPEQRATANPVPKIELPKLPRPTAKEKPKSRFPLLAATLALAAGLGGAAGAVGVPALVHLGFGQATAAAPTNETIAEVQALKASVAQLTTDLGALRTGVDQSSKLTTAHFGKVTDRLDRAERAQAEPAAKLAKIAEALERLERRAAQPAPTPTPAPAPAPAPADVTGSVKPTAPPVPEAKPKPPIIEDYVVRRVFDGVALVEGRRGIIEVEPGSTLPGAGRVEEIRRQDGRWVVVTSKGLITSAR
jgi:hypothetical protein